MRVIGKKSLLIVSASVLVVSAYFIFGILLLASAQYDDINIKNLEEAVRVYGGFTPSEVFTNEQAANAWASHLEECPYRITLINRNGHVIFDTTADSSTMENHLNRAEFQAAISGGIGTARRNSTTLGQDYIYAALAMYDLDNKFSGVIRLSNLVPGFSSRLFSSAVPFLLGGFVIVLAACTGLYYFSRRLSHLTEARLDAELEKKTLELSVRTEEAEAEDRQREVILNSMFEGVIALDSNLKIILANPRICSLFVMKTENDADTRDVRGMPLLVFSRSTELEEAARQVLLSAQPAELTLKLYITGTEQHFQVLAAPLKSGKKTGANTADEKVQGVVIVMSNISRLVRLEQVRKDFAANVSHELRTPIQVIKGFAENILDSSLGDKVNIRHFAELIAKNAEAMENLTADLMTLVSLEDKNSQRLPMEEFSLSSLISEAMSMVEIASRKKNIFIDVSCPPQLTAKLYGPLIVQALINLLSNGISYSSNGSCISVSAYSKGNQLVIEVKDKGIGIPAEHIGRIFERFYRVDRARSREAGGTGLGLAIVRHIALFHGGNVEVESHAGEGSMFRLTLPECII